MFTLYQSVVKLILLEELGEMVWREGGRASAQAAALENQT